MIFNIRNIIAFFILALSIPHGNAVVLGESFARSSFGYPLFAEIEMFEIAESDIPKLKIEEASLQTYHNNGLDRPSIGDIEIGAYSSRGISWLSVTSTNAVFSRSIDVLLLVSLAGYSEIKLVRLSPIGGPPN